MTSPGCSVIQGPAFHVQSFVKGPIGKFREALHARWPSRSCWFPRCCSPDPQFARGVRPGTNRLDCRRRTRYLRCRASGCHRRSIQPGPHREKPLRRERRSGAIHDRRSASRHLQRRVYSSGIRHRQARRHRADVRIHGERQCRSEGRNDRRDGHRHRRISHRRHAEHDQAGHGVS